MVTDIVWETAGMQAMMTPGPDQFLCVGCLERRLGRRLGPQDFTRAPINEDDPWKTERLRSRLREEHHDGHR
jgi:hypothetical protein